MSNSPGVSGISLDISMQNYVPNRVFMVCLLSGIHLKSVCQIKRVETHTRN